MSRIGGVVYLRVNGNLYTLGDGEVTVNVGGHKREAVLSSAGVAGFSSKPQVPYCEGELIYTSDLEVSDLVEMDDIDDVTIELFNGKTFSLQNAWWAGDGNIKSDGKMEFRFEGLRAEITNT